MRQRDVYLCHGALLLWYDLATLTCLVFGIADPFFSPYRLKKNIFYARSLRSRDIFYDWNAPNWISIL